MDKLPVLTAKEIIKVLKQAGFIEDRQKGSHLILINPTTKFRAVIPIHAGKTINRPLLKTIIKESGLSTEEFIKLL